MTFKYLSLLFFILTPMIANAAVVPTVRGKIAFTEGHVFPKCRMVEFVENDTGISKSFRIDNIENNDINSVLLAALATQNDVQIWFDESVTSGCGPQPRIQYIRLFSN